MSIILSLIFCPPLSRKCWDIKSHSSVRRRRLSVTKTLTLAITFALFQVELWYLACVFFVTRPFRWYHVVTLTVTFDLLKGQICCRAGDHNSLNLLVAFEVQYIRYSHQTCISVCETHILPTSGSSGVIWGLQGKNYRTLQFLPYMEFVVVKMVISTKLVLWDYQRVTYTLMDSHAP